MAHQALSDRIDRLDWPKLASRIQEQGFVAAGPVLHADECRDLTGLYDRDIFRSRIDMARHNFGRGEYKYFADPLPAAVAILRATFYRHLAPLARIWAPALGMPASFPDEHDEFRRICRDHGQTKPTPLLLRYREGDFNCLHQDIYGEAVFPLQVAILLSRPGDDFAGGEFLLVEQRPRAQSRGHVVPLGQGEAVIFATRYRPRTGSRGTHRVALRHGVATVTQGQRITLGVIFHDAA